MPASPRLPAAVLFDRDGTLVVDVPHNGDPRRVVPLRGTRAALDRLRTADVPLGLVSNQSGVGRGLLRRAQVDAVNDRLQELVGRLDAILVCPHAPDDGCLCRKPRPGLVLAAARQLGVDTAECVVVGDSGSDLAAASAAGAQGILVPTAATPPETVAAAERVAPDLDHAVDLVLGAGR